MDRVWSCCTLVAFMVSFCSQVKHKCGSVERKPGRGGVWRRSTVTKVWPSVALNVPAWKLCAADAVYFYSSGYVTFICTAFFFSFIEISDYMDVVVSHWAVTAGKQNFITVASLEMWTRSLRRGSSQLSRAFLKHCMMTWDIYSKKKISCFSFRCSLLHGLHKRFDDFYTADALSDIT